ncbi:sulfite exporter TauE/SafE family protein [Streptococcus entericus]|uniref:sulfite exporter TauE/SafE family protein n=1 Tax=Streptococcus entericus TaxID=155680 RepID=UPI00035EEE71|nr:sulfite exporter TauE/SafE family protein [Streptococcus entericus]
MIYVIYLLVVFFATCIGAVTGVGGGAIIKPIFDRLGYDSAVIIGAYSSIAVFTMCLSSLVRQLRIKPTVDSTVLVGLSLGSVCGGFFGEQLFHQMTNSVPNETVKAWQAGLLILVLLFTTGYHIKKESLPTYRVKNAWLIIFLGLAIGMLSIFLGIGGGPLNIAVLVILFSYTVKEAAMYSLAMIFFAQLPKIALIVWKWQSYGVSLGFVSMLIIAAIAGGLIGTWGHRRLTDKQVNVLFLALTMAIIGISVMNLVTNLI